MVKVKVFLKVVQTSRSRSLGQKFGTHGKVLSQGMYIWNMKALGKKKYVCLLSHAEKN